MRRWQLCLALSFLTSVTYVPAADAALSAEERARAIVSGLLTDAADHPTAGGVELFAWPTGRPVEVGQTVELLPIGSDRAGKDGRFAITGDLTPDLAELARLNGGYINFVLQAAAAGVLEETHFSRYVGDTPITAEEAGRPRRPIEWRAAPEEAAEPVRVNLPEAPKATTTSGDRPISPMQGGCYGTKLVESRVADTVIGELRAPHDTVEASFTYGKRADSEIGVVTKGSQGPWKGSGSFHIANSEDTEVTQWARSDQHLLVKTRFLYDRFEFTCPSGKFQKVVAREWMGDIQSEATTVHGCAGAPEERLGRYTPETEVKRNKEKAVRWEGAAGVFGASLNARSGYSRWVRGYWRFGRDPMHLLCGDDGPPKQAGHIFAGTSA
jgi:hypothetical protein